jgi:RNA polymerase sigma-70 factor (ECF subfamily)
MSTVADDQAGRLVRPIGSVAVSPAATSAERQEATPTLQTVHAEHYAFLCRCLRGLGVEAEALDDAAQEVLFVVHRRLGEYRPQMPLRSWLFRIAAHVAQNQRRTARRRRAREEQHAVPLSHSIGPEAHVEGHEALALTEQFLDGLDEGMRAVFVLGLLEGLPAPEVAAALGIGVNTVYSRVRLLRQSFRALLAQHYQEALR